MGTRMVGQQTVITAGLHPAVTAMMALVPSNCDAAGPIAGRAAGFPDDRGGLAKPAMRRSSKSAAISIPKTAPGM
jgi:hypothetical protein